jgi:hypothetical protein
MKLPANHAIAGKVVIGLKTRLAEIVLVGGRPVALMIAQTAFLAALVLVMLLAGFLHTPINGDFKS